MTLVVRLVCLLATLQLLGGTNRTTAKESLDCVMEVSHVQCPAQASGSNKMTAQRNVVQDRHEDEDRAHRGKEGLLFTLLEVSRFKPGGTGQNDIGLTVQVTNESHRAIDTPLPEVSEICRVGRVFLPVGSKWDCPGSDGKKDLLHQRDATAVRVYAMGTCTGHLQYDVPSRKLPFVMHVPGSDVYVVIDSTDEDDRVSGAPRVRHAAKKSTLVQLANFKAGMLSRYRASRAAIPKTTGSAAQRLTGELQNSRAVQSADLAVQLAKLQRGFVSYLVAQMRSSGAKAIHATRRSSRYMEGPWRYGIDNLEMLVQPQPSIAKLEIDSEKEKGSATVTITVEFTNDKVKEILARTERAVQNAKRTHATARRKVAERVRDRVAKERGARNTARALAKHARKVIDEALRALSDVAHDEKEFQVEVAKWKAIVSEAVEDIPRASSSPP